MKKVFVLTSLILSLVACETEELEIVSSAPITNPEEEEEMDPDADSRCAEITEFKATVITTQSVSIAWTFDPNGVLNPSSWEVGFKRSDAGADIPPATTKTVSTSISFENLKPQTTYKFYVRTNCSNDQFSGEWKTLRVTTF